jgi:hypothetical protein
MLMANARAWVVQLSDAWLRALDLLSCRPAKTRMVGELVARLWNTRHDHGAVAERLDDDARRIGRDENHLRDGVASESRRRTIRGRTRGARSGGPGSPYSSVRTR